MANLSHTKQVSLREDIFRGSSPLRVDREKGVIHGAKLLGLSSSNGRTYTLASIRKAAGLYEGKAVNIDHRAKPNQPRSAHDRFGRVVNVTVKDDGLYGDVEYLRSHPMAERVAEAAERMPGIYGMSHDAWGEGKGGPGKPATVIESITTVNSVDLVCDPATVKGLFENAQQGYAMTPEEMAASGASPEETLKAGFKASMVAVLDDDSLDMAGKLAKIKELMKAQEKVMGAGEEKKSEGEMPAEEKPAAEQAETKQPDANAQQLQEQQELATFRREKAARALCDQAGLIPTAVQLKALVALTEETDLKALIQGFKAVQTNGQKAKSTAPAHLQEQQAKKATDGKSLATLIKRRR